MDSNQNLPVLLQLQGVRLPVYFSVWWPEMTADGALEQR